MNYQVPEGLQVKPLSVKGRYFAFTATPPTVLQIDAAALLLLRLCDSGLNGEGLVARYAELRRKSTADARAEVARRADNLVGVGLLKRLPA